MSDPTLRDLPFPRAPEICVEIVSPSNSAEETREKVRAYLAAGALEVWLVLEEGRVKYFDGTGEVAGTRFPVRLELPGSLPPR